MGNLGHILAGFGMIGIIGAFIIGFLLILIIPISSIFDCAYSNRDGGTKVLIIILLILSWTFGSLIYSLFFPHSKTLRKFSVFSICGLIILAIFSISSLMGGAKISQDFRRKQKAIQEKRLIFDLPKVFGQR